ncbi:MAG: hypothetical protein R2734_08600 [Nocardioides sp.]
MARVMSARLGALIAARHHEGLCGHWPPKMAKTSASVAESTTPFWYADADGRREPAHNL